MGTPNLYRAKLSFEIGKQVSDATSVTFGIREVVSELTDKRYRLFQVNGRKVLIRGAAWAPDLLFRWSSERLDSDLAYVRDMGMNTIRLEGRLNRDELIAKSDRVVRFGTKGRHQRRIGRKNDRSLRVCAPGVLAGGLGSRWRLRLQHGDKSGAGDSATGISGEIHP